jgi:DNA-binding NarL/FixJ family response regulator
LASRRAAGLLAPSITRRLIVEFSSKRRGPASHDAKRLAELTEREREVLVLIARGVNNEEIAEELVISPATSKTHVSRIMSKLVVIAYETGLVRCLNRPIPVVG